MRRPVLGGAVLLAVGIGCSLVTSYDGFTGSAAPSALTPCGKRIPDAPSADDPGTDPSAASLVGIMKAARFVSAPSSPLGYNLDGLCTCSPVNPQPACRNATSPDSGGPCDIDGGIDNAAGAFIGQFFGGQTTSIPGGAFGLVVTVTKWNGNPNDRDVSVSIQNATQIRGASGGDASFDGNDVVDIAASEVINPATFSGGSFSDTAYVTGGVLVAKFKLDVRFNVTVDRESLEAGVGPAHLQIPLRGAALVGRIAQSGPNKFLMTEGQLVGRIARADLVDQVGRIGLCVAGGTPDPTGKLYAIASLLCYALDLPPNDQLGAQNTDCDAVSFAIGLDLVGGTIAGKGDVQLSPNACGNAALVCPPPPPK